MKFQRETTIPQGFTPGSRIHKINQLIKRLKIYVWGWLCIDEPYIFMEQMSIFMKTLFFKQYRIM